MTLQRRGAAPRAGRSLEGLVAPLREHVLDAVAAAERVAPTEPDWLRAASARDLITQAGGSRGAWAFVAVLLVDMVRTGLSANWNRAANWFGLLDEQPDCSGIENALAPLAAVPHLSDFLPYLLDTYGRTTRLDVIRDSSLAGSRAERKKAGSFYTPQDVADFMVRSIAAGADDAEADTEWWLDPALGSGVFLAAALRHHLAGGRDDGEAFATTRLTGFDVSPQACDFTSFVILGGIAHVVRRPLAAWTSIRGNLIALDATKPDHERGGERLRDLLAPKHGPLRLICNPPYANAGSGMVVMADGRPTNTLYLPFVEMAWRVAVTERDAACLVVPLALGANRSADHRRCRMSMAAAGGDWTLLFFDRQPHALFGEEAKTRATIAIRRPGPAPANIRTSRLLKWTSRQREAIFNETRAASITGVSVGRLVPKLGSDDEVALYRTLERHRLRSGSRPDPVKASATEIVGNALSADVFVAGTAYNFLNVFRNYPDQLSWRGTLSASGLHRLPSGDIETADAVLAILTSRMAFWLWHVECDGFHVPAWFLSEMPLLNLRLNQAAATDLARLGRAIWKGLQEDIICSSNRERLTFAFRPTHVAALRDEVDALLAAALGADANTVMLLRSFESEVVSIDGSIRLAKNFKNKE